MAAKTKLDGLSKFAWFVLGYNILVILWGVFLRASKSGDGCGRHWLTCHGEVIPSAPEIKTAIEFSHRVSTSIAGILIIVLVGWTFARWRSRNNKQNWLTFANALISLLFVVVEGLLGAGLVLTGNTAENLTPERPIWMAGHLINTLILLAFLTFTARYASGGAPLHRSANRKYKAAVWVGVISIMLVGITGSIAALASLVFPSATLVEGIAMDFSPTSNLILRLRFLHPLIAILSSVFIVFLVGWLAKESGKDPKVVLWSNVLSILVLVQIGVGAVTLLLLAPILLQIFHLLMADAIWVSFVMAAASFLAIKPGMHSISERDLTGQ